MLAAFAESTVEDAALSDELCVPAAKLLEAIA
jgi:hypothetical protein